MQLISSWTHQNHMQPVNLCLIIDRICYQVCARMNDQVARCCLINVSLFSAAQSSSSKSPIIMSSISSYTHSFNSTSVINNSTDVSSISFYFDSLSSDSGSQSPWNLTVTSSASISLKVSLNARIKVIVSVSFSSSFYACAAFPCPLPSVTILPVHVCPCREQ